MTLTLQRKPVSQELLNSRLDLYGLVPDRVLGLDVASIAQLPIGIDGRAAIVQELFEIIDGPRDTLLLTGDLSQADRVGGGMLQGTLTVESDVGSALAENMRQGDLIIHGRAGEYACSQLRGGRVRITKDVGDYCGAAPTGSRRGMRGGSVVIEGSAGRFLGYRMRRGTLHVRGDVAEGCGSSMIAGSILIGGAVATPLAVAMRRGTVVLFGTTTPQLPIGFTPFEPVKLSFLPLLLSQAEPDLSPNCRENLPKGIWHRSLGDRASEGLGEILWLRPKDEEVLQ